MLSQNDTDWQDLSDLDSSVQQLGQEYITATRESESLQDGIDELESILHDLRQKCGQKQQVPVRELQQLAQQCQPAHTSLTRALQ